MNADIKGLQFTREQYYCTHYTKPKSKDGKDGIKIYCPKCNFTLAYLTRLGPCTNNLIRLMGWAKFHNFEFEYIQKNPKHVNKIMMFHIEHDLSCF